MLAKLKLNTKDETLRELLSNGKRYYVPKFQRDYSWNLENWEILWEDISAIINNEEDYHYMGYLVIQEGKERRYKIIDGQQRITTFSLLILAAIKRLGEIGGEEERQSILKREFIGSKNATTLEVQNKLELNINNGFHYKRVTDGIELPKRGEKATVISMGKAMEYFLNVLQKYTKGKDVSKIIYSISDRLLFTTIYISDELNAYKIFETLNARGIKLSSSDLVKNYIFSSIDSDDNIPQSVINDLDEKWSYIGVKIGSEAYTDYIHVQWNARNSLVRQKNLFKHITEEINNNKSKAEHYLNQLYEHSSIYEGIINPQSEFFKDHCDYSEIKKSLYFLDLFKIKQPRSLILISYIKHKNDFAKILRWIKIFSLRYNVICNAHPGEQEILYNKIALAISKNCQIGDIKNELLRLYPTDNKFMNEFLDKSIKTNHSEKKARYILARLEEHKSNSSIDESTLTIEHILPKKPNDNWFDYFGKDYNLFNDRVGNFALVSKAVNNDLGQKGFKEKQKILSKSEYKINNIDNYIQRSPQTIESRQQQLAKVATQTWRID